MCGHFPEGVETFEKTSIDGETRGEWYLRQMLGSANISGSQGHALHDRQPVAPDRAPPVPGPAEQPVRRDRAAGARPSSRSYGLNYHAASLPQQVGSAWHKVVRLSLPNGWLATTNAKNAPAQLKMLWKMTTGGPKVRRAAPARLQQQARRQEQVQQAA